MQRYFIEVAYMGTHYSGFQVQQNANSVQAEVEKALNTLYKVRLRAVHGEAGPAIQAEQAGTEAPGNSHLPITLTGSSRTDAGVHALQNYFHLDLPFALITNAEKDIYHLNAILPADIVIKSIRPVTSAAHCRFDALSREYHYHIYQQKNPFLAGRSYYYPYKLDFELLQQAAAELLNHQDFTSFSKRNSQVHTHICNLQQSRWQANENGLVYKVQANRFLRGMVRGLTGTMLLVGRKKITITEFKAIIDARDCAGADFSVPGHGLFLAKVVFPQNIAIG
jgi:tRNA pseudouridine38-40 synthase